MTSIIGSWASNYLRLSIASAPSSGAKFNVISRIETVGPFLVVFILIKVIKTIEESF